MSVNKNYVKKTLDNLQTKCYKKQNRISNKSRYYEIQSTIDAEWREIIVLKHHNKSVELISIMPPRIDYTMNEEIQSFNQ